MSYAFVVGWIVTGLGLIVCAFVLHRVWTKDLEYLKNKLLKKTKRENEKK